MLHYLYIVTKCKLFYSRQNIIDWYLTFYRSVETEVKMNHINSNTVPVSTFLSSERKPKMHYKCRNSTYPRTNIRRLPVSDAQVSWDVDYKGYSPVMFIDECAKRKPWSDPEARFVDCNCFHIDSFLAA